MRESERGGGGGGRDTMSAIVALAMCINNGVNFLERGNRRLALSRDGRGTMVIRALGFCADKLEFGFL